MTTLPTQTTKLSDTQLVLLSAASQRQDRTVVSSETLSERAFVRATNTLTKMGLIAVREPSADGVDHPDDEPSASVFVITPAGLAAIGLPEPVQARTKRAHIIALLSREAGATMEDLIAATGWLPHTTRAALTGLRQKGYGIEREQRQDRISVYRIVSRIEQSQAA